MRPTTAEATATGSHQESSLNTPQPAAAKPITATSARMFSTVQAAPSGGRVLPANDAVIHMNVVPKRNSPIAMTFLNVNIRPHLPTTRGARPAPCRTRRPLDRGDRPTGPGTDGPHRHNLQIPDRYPVDSGAFPP